MDIEKLKKEIGGLTEPRRTGYGNIRHKLEDIVIIGLCTIICNGEDYCDMETFGNARERWLRMFLELPNGIPDSDTFRRVFERLKPLELSNCLSHWLELERARRSVVAVDGKTIRGSADANHKAYHVVSAFVAENQISLGEIAVAEKSNEITAVPELLDLIDVKGCIVTADAMNCQKKTVEKIARAKADYVIALKENQPALFDDVKLYFEMFRGGYAQTSTVEKGHGCIETRHYRLLNDVSWLGQRKEWRNLRAVGAVTSTREKGNESSSLTRYFITSLTTVEEFADAVRKHWSIENQLHWCLDVIFHEDASRARKDNSPLNLNVLRKHALALVNQAKHGRISKKRMMFTASLDPDLLLDILFPDQKK